MDCFLPFSRMDFGVFVVDAFSELSVGCGSLVVDGALEGSVRGGGEDTWAGVWAGVWAVGLAGLRGFGGFLAAAEEEGAGAGLRADGTGADTPLALSSCLLRRNHFKAS